jgi:hypothetical protein
MRSPSSRPARRRGSDSRSARPYVGIDVDEELSAIEQDLIIFALNSYAERSPSGKGHHVIVKASLNGGGRHPAGIGVFQTDRFFYCTGEHVTGTPTTIEERQDKLEEVIEAFLPAREVCTAVPTSRKPVALDDRELLERMFASKSGEKIRRLWEGDTSGYPSQSEADLALLTHLAFWTNRDVGRMESLFRGSGLYREEGPQKPKGVGYLARTIETAIAATPEGYRQPIPKPETVSEKVEETASPPAREGSREATFSRFPDVGKTEGEKVATTAPSALLVELVFQSAADFAAEDEPNAEMVLGIDDDDAAFVAGGTVVVFGKGGGGKTTLVTDIACHVATGTDWQGLKVPKARRVAVVENDGPRGRFRRKVRAKLAAWKGDDLGDNLRFLSKPWGKLKLSLEDHRVALAAYINENEVDILVAGPIVSLGMIGGGTPDEVAAFEAHLQALRDLLDRPLLVILLHHTNQRGQISGAWDRVPTRSCSSSTLGRAPVSCGRRRATPRRCTPSPGSSSGRRGWRSSSTTRRTSPRRTSRRGSSSRRRRTPARPGMSSQSP